MFSGKRVSLFDSARIKKWHVRLILRNFLGVRNSGLSWIISYHNQLNWPMSRNTTPLKLHHCYSSGKISRRNIENCGQNTWSWLYFIQMFLTHERTGMVPVSFPRTRSTCKSFLYIWTALNSARLSSLVQIIMRNLTSFFCYRHVQFVLHAVQFLRAFMHMPGWMNKMSVNILLPRIPQTRREIRRIRIHHRTANLFSSNLLTRKWQNIRRLHPEK